MEKSYSEIIHDTHEKFIEKHFGKQDFSLTGLWHYTSLSSATSILQTGRLRFTEARFLNDPKELEEPLNLAFNVINNLLKKYDNNIFKTNLLTLLRNILDANLNLHRNSNFQNQLKESFKKDKIQDTKVYCFSLSHEADHLSQWISYSDNGKGIALEFDFSNLDSFFKEFQHVDIVRCNYKDISHKLSYAEEFLDVIIDLIKDNTSPLEYTKFCFILLDYLIHDITASKDGAWHLENELRLYLMDRATSLKDAFSEKDFIEKFSPGFFTKDNIIKPHYDIEFPKETLKSICMGPRCDEVNRYALEIIKSKYDYNFKILQSSISLR